jgi:enterochelin esterase-like enzyme
MRSISRASAVIVCPFSFLAGIAYAQQPSATHPHAFPKVTIAGSEVRMMKSTSTGRDNDLYIHLPSNYDQDKTKKYPVLYILDGGAE